MNKIFFDKLFPKVTGINLNKLQIDIDTMSFITTPYYSKIIGSKISAHLAQLGVHNNICIVDSTACVGGDTITFAILFDQVVSIELNEKWYNYLKHNVEQYKLNNVLTIKGDSMTIIPNLSGFHAIYIDPPWGGKQYKFQHKLRLSFGKKTLEHAIIDLFDPKYDQLRLIAVKLPRNYDLKYLYETIAALNRFDVYLYELKKINFIIIQIRLG